MSGPTRFRDLRLQWTYEAGDDRLGDFYVPVLQAAVTYDRLVGYWRSSSLAVAAAGVTYFIRNALEHGGRMRIIAGAELTDADIDAVERGEPLEDAVARRLVEAPDEAVDVVAEERLRILAWMVKEGLVEVKVGVPLDADGKPLGAEEADRLFHTKFGILTDASGDRLCFVGSQNESAKGWRLNHEDFSVYPSWKPDIWQMYGQPRVEQFTNHWESPPPAGWQVLDLPEAARRDLLKRLPDTEDWTPPKRDPVEIDEETRRSLDEARRELQWLQKAPSEKGGTGVGLVTLPIVPWPHQHSIASKVLATWPRSYLFADEVGLGKTIEAGMVIRELVLSGKATKVLLLVPASVQRQWQEELYEKFCLDVPSFDGKRFWRYDKTEIVPPAGANPWSAFEVVLASSHLARRRDRRPQLLAAAPWDLVFVDEAHHARRRGVGGAEGANQLLQLLRALRDNRSYRALLLATATPMQMDTSDIFDLLDLFGLPGSWADSPETFEAYYRQLAEPDPKARDWDLLRAMLADFFAQPDVQPNRAMRDRIVRELTGPARMRIEQFHKLNLSGSQIAAAAENERRLLDGWLQANTPIRDRVTRTSRQALRVYKEQGILPADTVIPERHIHDRFIPLDPVREERLYERIDDYITRYYEQYNRDKATKPLGFIMTVYRRRLTSSLYAVHKSLQRRLEKLRQEATLDELLDDDDRYALEYSTRFEPDLFTGKARQYAEELAELESFIGELEWAIPEDSKIQRLIHDIEAAFLAGHHTVVVFTQFTDTLDWVRDQLKGTYGAKVACYTGKGGSRWNPDTGEWETLSKAEVKDLFRKGDEVKILLGTDAMSEGLNLQTCDYLINCDMPWNFMRAEQRIGRVDRIGGQPHIQIVNYFYENTVEEQVYRGIQNDAEWFESVVGPAQPVLSQIETVIESIAMKPADLRREALRQELDEVRQAIRAAQERPLTIGELENPDVVDGPNYAATPVVTLSQIERILTSNPLTKRRIHMHPDFAHTYYVEVDGNKLPATFDPKVYDENPEVGFLTYRIDVFERLIQEALE